MKFSYSWLKELNPKIDTPEKAAEQLTFHSFTVESTEPQGKDFVFDIDSKSLGRRAADAAGHVGMARELAVINGHALSVPRVSPRESLPRASEYLTLAIAKGAPASRHSGRLVFEIANGASPQWMQERLLALGLRPINLVVDVTNYVMLEVGQPLHAFDYDKLAKPRKGSKVVIDIRFARADETLDVLGESRRYPLTKNDLVLADADGALDIAGVKGGKRSEVTKDTKRIFLSAAHFDGPTIRKTSKRLGLRTDASWRFERGMDLEGTVFALDRAAALIQKFGDGRVLKGVVDVGVKRPKKRSIPLRFARVNSLLGAGVPEAAGTGILNHLGCEVKRITAGTYRAAPPSWRPDLVVEEDLVEEIGRIWGYEKVHPEMPMVKGGIMPKADRQVFEDEIKTRLAGYGFTESHLPSFTGKSELALFGAAPDEYFELENPTSPDAAYLVAAPATKYVRSVAENLRNFDSVRIFGITRAFFNTDKGPMERRHLVIALAEKGKDGREEFYMLKGFIDALLESFGISDYWYDDQLEPGIMNQESSILHQYRMAEIKVGDTKIGMIGEISQNVREALKAHARIVIAEFDVEWLLDQIESEQEFRPIARFPAVIRDIAVVIPENVKTESVMNVIESAGGGLLVDTDLFDYFQNERVGESQKSLAFHLVFQSPERTLRDEEVEVVFGKIVSAVKGKGWDIR
ncbi:MAG: phenylalanine--tRNA ligase subunit beta [Candidatus Sungbacteria bacterium]|nr:phenylalanine--tRNA ligase subunit beta [Candidatus Sungbacteria bacterium]